MGKLDELLELICDLHDVDPNAVKSKSRYPEATRVRHLFHYFAKLYHPEYSQEKISSVTQRNHSTLVHSINKVIPSWYATNRKGKPVNPAFYNIFEMTKNHLDECYGYNQELVKRKNIFLEHRAQMEIELNRLKIAALKNERRLINKRIKQLESDG